MLTPITPIPPSYTLFIGKSLDKFFFFKLNSKIMDPVGVVTLLNVNVAEEPSRWFAPVDPLLYLLWLPLSSIILTHSTTPVPLNWKLLFILHFSSFSFSIFIFEQLLWLCIVPVLGCSSLEATTFAYVLRCSLKLFNMDRTCCRYWSRSTQICIVINEVLPKNRHLKLNYKISL